MAVYKDIRATLESHLASISGLPSTIVWETVKKEPAVGSPYMVVKFIPTSTRPAHLGPLPQERYQGLFKVTVYCPANQGPGQLESYLDLIIDNFRSTSDITVNGFTVSVEYTERTEIMDDGTWVMASVLVAWYIYS